MSIPPDIRPGETICIEIELDTRSHVGVLRGHQVVELSGALGVAVFGRKADGIGSWAEHRRSRNASETLTRNAVGKVLVDMRSLACALESYYVDRGCYPVALSPALTTPVSYITRIPVDPFTKDRTPIQYLLDADGRDWLLYSVGPDAVSQGGRIMFDPTNGTISGGDVIRRRVKP